LQPQNNHGKDEKVVVGKCMERVAYSFVAALMGGGRK
jgi:hypothetical protein